jgi:phosphate transport system protein
MRSRFEEQLERLNESLIRMGLLTEQAIRRAAQAFFAGDRALAREVIEGDEQVNELEREIESRSLKLLLQQQPVARDLRHVSTALKMITDLERIADHAASISELTLSLTEQECPPPMESIESIEQMAEETIRMVNKSVDAYVRRDFALAKVVIEYDEKVNLLFVGVRHQLIDLIRQSVDNGEQALALLMVAKYLERIGDHAVNIAEWVIFARTGKHKHTRII